MNIRSEDRKYHQYSLSFYQKENELISISREAKLDFRNFDKHQKILKASTIELFMRFNEGNKTAQKQLLQENREAAVEMFFDLVKSLGTQRKLMDYVMPTLDAVFTEDRHILRYAVEGIRQGKYKDITALLRAFLSIGNYSEIVCLAAARIVSILLGQLPKQQFGEEQKNFLLDLLQARRTEAKTRLSWYGLATCFVHLNKHKHLAEVFLEHGGTILLLDSLTRTGNDIQLIYYSLLNIWMLSFTHSGIENFIGNPRMGVIKTICQVLQKVSREKITRIAFIIFKSIEHNHLCLELMIDNKLLKIIDTILKGNIKDNQLLESIKDIGSVLESNMKVLSSFEKYYKEITSEYLEWSSVHTERFWKENFMKCEDNDYKVLKYLKEHLMSERPLNVAIACYDIGEFTRLYPKGKAVIENFGMKNIIMERARYSNDKMVKEQALLALQKIMIQNWQAI